MSFVLLEHRLDDATPAPGAPPLTDGAHPPASAVHWDFLLEVAGQESLATWRLSENPVATSGAIRAERIGDHRRAYLDYEGPISGGRGSVRRVDRGAAVVEALDNARLTVTLDGEHLKGRYAIRTEPRGGFVFERAERENVKK